MIILGIDPGSIRTGWGVVVVEGSRLSHVAHGGIKPDDSLDLAQRLLILFEAITQVVAEHQPHEAAVEETFVNVNPASTLKLGQARGVAVHKVTLQLYAEGLIDGVRVDHIDGLTDPAGYCKRLRVDPETKKPARAGYRFDEDGKKVRTIRPGGKDI